MTDFESELEERLIRYAVIDTQSDETSTTSPSTEKQFDLLNLLAEELRGIGATDVWTTDYDVVLDAADRILSPEQSPYLGQRIGDDIVTASGTTQLGVDGKAGIAIIMTAARHLLANPSIPHGPIRIAFTPDEEIGRRRRRAPAVLSHREDRAQVLWLTRRDFLSAYQRIVKQQGRLDEEVSQRPLPRPERGDGNRTSPRSGPRAPAPFLQLRTAGGCQRHRSLSHKDRPRCRV